MGFDWRNMLSQTPWQYGKKAASNIWGRGKQMYGSGGFRDVPGTALKYMLKPQSTYAATGLSPPDLPQYGPFQNEMTDGAQPTSAPAGGQVLGATTAGGGGGTAPEEPPFEAWFQGVKYDDPAAYQEAVSGAMLEEYNRTKTQLDRAYDAGLIDFSERERQLRETRDKTIQSQQGYFSAISPQALQNQQQTYAGETKETYQRGEEQRQRERSDFKANVLDAIAGATSNYENQLDMLQNSLTQFIDQGGPDYGNYVAPEYSKETSAETMGAFGRQNLTGKFYGRAVPTKPKYSAKKKTPAPPEEYIYT